MTKQRQSLQHTAAPQIARDSGQGDDGYCSGSRSEVQRAAGGGGEMEGEGTMRGEDDDGRGETDGTLP